MTESEAIDNKQCRQAFTGLPSLSLDKNQPISISRSSPNHSNAAKTSATAANAAPVVIILDESTLTAPLAVDSGASASSVVEPCAPPATGDLVRGSAAFVVRIVDNVEEVVGVVVGTAVGGMDGVIVVLFAVGPPVALPPPPPPRSGGGGVALPGFSSRPVPQGISSPFGCVDSGGGVVSPEAEAMAKRPVQVTPEEAGEVNW